MSAALHQQWLATSTTLTFAEWRREQTVPAGLRVLPPVSAQPKPKVKRAPAPAVTRPKAKSRSEAARRAPGELVHGTPWGARRHKAAGEDACGPCDEALREYRRKHSRSYRLRTRGPAKELQPCGTKAAAVRHRKAREPLDDACKRAEREEWHKRPKKVAA